jgi:ubiquinone/menaquinone biosynthesis C-methylase UbiE
MSLEKYGQYKNDIFRKLGFTFESGKKILDCGSGDGTDAVIFIEEFGLDAYGIDIFEHENVKNIKGFKFRKAEAGIYKIPFEDGFFDYVFSHDVLHHIDEASQSYDNHIKGLKELLRVCKKGGHIIIVEGNRFNPLFYPHMVKMRGHNHFKQSYFKTIVNAAFAGNHIEFKFFEAHLYPSAMLGLFKIYEFLMEKIMPKVFLAYNAAIIRKGGDSAIPV